MTLSHSPKAYRLLCTLLLLGGLSHPTFAFADESLQALINRGNQAAENQDFATAIQAYEQGIKKAPSEKLLKTNLAVLYANYAVNFQEQKQYDTALQYLDKGMALVPADSKEARSIQNGRASVYFSQAMDLKESKEALTTADFAQIKALLEKALALSPGEVAFKKGMAGIYLDEAYQLAVQENFSDAMPLLEKARTYDPSGKAIKQSLANVYLGMARNDVANRKSWVEKALATDNSPNIQQVADKLLLVGHVSASTDGFAADPNEVKGQAPRAISQLSVSDMVRDMEAQLQVSPAKGATLNERLEVLERQVLGKPQTGALAVRTKTVYTALMGSFDGTLEQSNIHLTQAPALKSEDSYLDEIFKVTDGKVVRWGKFPLRIYFEAPKENALYKEAYKTAALKGFDAWKDRTDGYVKFLEVKNPQAADVIVNWTDAYVDRFADPEKSPSVYKDYTPAKRSRLLTVVQMASMFTPGYFSLVPQAAAAGLQYQQYKKLAIIQEESKIYLGLTPTKALNPEAANLLIQNMAAKEFGHALGLKGSSTQSGDLLYPELRSDIAQVPTNRDLQTLRELYNRPPNIILNTH